MRRNLRRIIGYTLIALGAWSIAAHCWSYFTDWSYRLRLEEAGNHWTLGLIPIMLGILLTLDYPATPRTTLPTNTEVPMHRKPKARRIIGYTLFWTVAVSSGWVVLMEETLSGNPMPFWGNSLGLLGVLICLAVFQPLKRWINRPRRQTSYLGHGCTLSRLRG